MGKSEREEFEKAIIVERLAKNFEITEKKSGLIGSLQTLIVPTKKTVRALKSISFSI